MNVERSSHQRQAWAYISLYIIKSHRRKDPVKIKHVVKAFIISQRFFTWNKTSRYNECGNTSVLVPRILHHTTHTLCISSALLGRNLTSIMNVWPFSDSPRHERSHYKCSESDFASRSLTTQIFISCVPTYFWLLIISELGQTVCSWSNPFRTNF